MGAEVDGLKRKLMNKLAPEAAALKTDWEVLFASSCEQGCVTILLPCTHNGGGSMFQRNTCALVAAVT